MRKIVLDSFKYKYKIQNTTMQHVNAKHIAEVARINRSFRVLVSCMKKLTHKTLTASMLLIGSAASFSAANEGDSVSDPISLTYMDYVQSALQNISPIYWLGTAVFVVLVAVIFGWLWGHAWNKQWKPWASTMPCYSIAALLAMLTCFTPLYLTGNGGEIGIFDPKDGNELTFDSINKKEWIKQAYFIKQTAANAMGLGQEKLEKAQEELKKYSGAQFNTIYDSYRLFMYVNMWGIMGAMGLLLILVAYFAYTDIRIIQPAVTSIITKEKNN